MNEVCLATHLFLQTPPARLIIECFEDVHRGLTGLSNGQLCSLSFFLQHLDNSIEGLPRWSAGRSHAQRQGTYPQWQWHKLDRACTTLPATYFGTGTKISWPARLGLSPSGEPLIAFSTAFWICKHQTEVMRGLQSLF